MKEIIISLIKNLIFFLKLKYNFIDVFIIFENFFCKVKIKGLVFIILKE